MPSNGNSLINQQDFTPAEILVGRKLRELRNKKGLSLRALAERSGLNFNTLSLVENGKSSPSVGTLQQIALALEVPISTFFETEPIEKRVVFTPADQRPDLIFGSTILQNLGENLAGSLVQPFVVTLKPGMGSGDREIVHTGHEFVYCLSGTLHYQIEQSDYLLNSGDSLVFESHLPHRWENNSQEISQILLVLFPSDQRETPGGRHFTAETMKKEITMKIAAITDDGKTISQHFGRAPYYLVLTIEEGKVVNRELREKLGHSQFSSQTHNHESHGADHGLDSASHDKHVSMAETISDCKALLCGGMGMGAYESMRRLNIQPVVTDLNDIEGAVRAFVDGKLIDHTELLH
ncbi:MAG TPA: helix-turn-helix domain-containing protein [Anaerolineaceae bacterium]|nr:helix-turn-helix domain-containing protein [Anaerolineaceae bacterium]